MLRSCSIAAIALAVVAAPLFAASPTYSWNPNGSPDRQIFGDTFTGVAAPYPYNSFSAENQIGLYTTTPGVLRVNGFTNNPSVYSTDFATINLTSTGAWYTFAMSYAKSGNGTTDNVIGGFAVYDSSQNLLGSTTLTTGLDSQELGNARYLWFTAWQAGFAGNLIGVDNVRAGTLLLSGLPDLSDTSFYQYGFETAPSTTLTLYDDWGNDLFAATPIANGGGLLGLTGSEGNFYYEMPRISDPGYIYGGDGGTTLFGSDRTPTVYDGDYYMAVDFFAFYAVPEPTSIGLLSIAAIGMLRRRRA